MLHVVLSEAVDWCICFTRKIKHGGDRERSRSQGPKNGSVHPLYHITENFLKRSMVAIISKDKSFFSTGSVFQIRILTGVAQRHSKAGGGGSMSNRLVFVCEYFGSDIRKIFFVKSVNEPSDKPFNITVISMVNMCSDSLWHYMFGCLQTYTCVEQWYRCHPCCNKTILLVVCSTEWEYDSEYKYAQGIIITSIGSSSSNYVGSLLWNVMFTTHLQ